MRSFSTCLGLIALSCHSATSASSATRAVEPARAPEAVALAPAPSEPVPLGPLPTDVRPTHESLALDIYPERARFGGTADIALHIDHPRDRIWLHGRGLVVSSATVTGASGAPLVARWEEVDPTGVVRVKL